MEDTTTKKINLIGWTGFIVMLIAFLLQRGCIGPETKYSFLTEKITEQKWDSVPKNIPVRYQVPGDSVVVEIPAMVDTAAILARYFNIYYYAQTITDTNLIATITDSVSQNRISKRTFQYQWLKPTSQTTITNTTITDSTKKRIELYSGGFASVGIDGTNAGLGINLALKTRKDLIYNIGFDAINRQVQLGVLVKINFGNKQ